MLNEDPLIDPKERKSILKELQKRRTSINNTQFLPPIPPSEPRKRHSSLISLHGTHDSIGPRSLLARYESTKDLNSESCLPTISVHSKLVGLTTPPGATLVTSDNVRGVLHNTVQPAHYAYPSDKYLSDGVIGERLSHSLFVRTKKTSNEMDLSQERLRVLPVDAKLTIDTGKWLMKGFISLSV